MYETLSLVSDIVSDLTVILDLQKLLKNNFSYTKSKKRQELIAYTIAPLNSAARDRFLRCDWAPGILVFLFVVLVFVASAQVVLIHYGDYGAFSGYSYTYSAGGTHLLAKLAASAPPPKININSLLNRNVPSIMTNLKKLQYDINVDALNSLLNQQQQKRPTVVVDENELNEIEENDEEFSKPLINGSSNYQQQKNSNYSNRTKLLPDCPLVPVGLSKRKKK